MTMSQSDHEYFRTMLTISALVVALGMFAIASQFKIEAAELIPNGMTCADVQRVAAEHQIDADSTWDRIKIRAIALAHGYHLTRSQIDTAVKCLRRD